MMVTSFIHCTGLSFHVTITIVNDSKEFYVHDTTFVFRLSSLNTQHSLVNFCCAARRVSGEGAGRSGVVAVSTAMAESAVLRGECVSE